MGEKAGLMGKLIFLGYHSRGVVSVYLWTGGVRLTGFLVGVGGVGHRSNAPPVLDDDRHGLAVIGTVYKRKTVCPGSR